MSVKTLRGTTKNERQTLARRCTAGELHRLHPNIYVPAADWATLTETQKRRLHHLTAADGRRDMVIVGRSAALVHGLDIIEPMPTDGHPAPQWPVPPGDDIIELGHPTRRKFETRGTIHESKLAWGPDEVVVVDGRAVTSPGATVADITRRHGFGAGLVAADSALRLGHSAIDLMRPAALGPNPAAALRTVACASQFPDSAPESLLRAQIIDAGLPAPEVQLRVFTADGIFIAQVDLAYAGWLLMVEIHGEAKFSGRYGDGQARSKYEWRRETEMLQKGLAVLRVTYPQVVSGEGVRMVAEALERQRRVVAAGAVSSVRFVPAGRRWPKGFRMR